MGILFSLYAILGLHNAFRDATQHKSEKAWYNLLQIFIVQKYNIAIENIKKWFSFMPGSHIPVCCSRTLQNATKSFTDTKNISGFSGILALTGAIYRNV